MVNVMVVKEAALEPRLPGGLAFVAFTPIVMPQLLLESACVGVAGRAGILPLMQRALVEFYVIPVMQGLVLVMARPPQVGSLRVSSEPIAT